MKKAERRNSNHALTNAVNFGKQKDAGKKKSQSTFKRKGPANNKIKLIDPDNENISFSNNNVRLVISDIATPKPSSQILYQTNICWEFCSFVTSK